MFESSECSSKRGGSVAGSVVGHYGSPFDAAVGDEGLRSLPEGVRGFLALVAEDFGVGKAGVVVDDVMEVGVAEAELLVFSRTGFASELVVFDGYREVARHERVTTRYEEAIDLDHYLEVLRHKPGAMAGSMALAAARAEGSFTASHEAFWQESRSQR